MSAFNSAPMGPVHYVNDNVTIHAMLNVDVYDVDVGAHANI